MLSPFLSLNFSLIIRFALEDADGRLIITEPAIREAEGRPDVEEGVACTERRLLLQMLEEANGSERVRAERIRYIYIARLIGCAVE